MPRHWLTILVLIALVGGAVLLLDSQPEVLQAGIGLRGDEDVQLTGYLTGVETTQYGQSGEVEYNFSAERMSHFQPDAEARTAQDYTTIVEPSFTFYRPEESPWFLEARRGRSVENGDLVILEEDVRLWQESPAGEPVLLTTTELQIRPESRLAETDQFVIIRYPRIVTTGVGMRADLAEETFSIQSQGSTTYEPTP